MSIKSLKLAGYIFCGIIVLLLGWLSLEYLLPCVAPFLLAFIFARLIEPLVRLMCRHGFRREVASGICALGLIFLFFACISAIFIYGAGELGSLSGNIPRVLYSAGELVGSARQKIREYTDGLPPEMSVWIDGTVGSLAAFFATLPTLISEQALTLLSRAASAAPTILLFSITCALGIYFISASYPNVQVFLDTQLPQRLQKQRLALNSSLSFTVLRYLRAQLILTLITMAELVFAFFLLRIENPVVMAGIIAILDALPILGAGVVLVPWALFAFLLSDVATGVGLGIVWVVVTIMRNCLQAKLLGDQLGLHPLITLVAIYIGWVVVGVWGMIIFPMLALIVKQLYTPEIFGRGAT